MSKRRTTTAAPIDHKRSSPRPVHRENTVQVSTAGACGEGLAGPGAGGWGECGRDFGVAFEVSVFPTFTGGLAVPRLSSGSTGKGSWGTSRDATGRKSAARRATDHRVCLADAEARRRPSVIKLANASKIVVLIMT